MEVSKASVPSTYAPAEVTSASLSIGSARRAAPPVLYVVEDNRRLYERLQEKLLARAAVVAPALLTGVVRREELARVVEGDARPILRRVLGGVRLRVSRSLRLFHIVKMK